MAALLETPDNSEAPSKKIVSEVFKPKDTLDQPCDVILVVEDGKEFKAHKQVLSVASSFFEKLLNSDMKESKEGVIRLEMFSESVMGNTLEFIYTGNVQILTEDNARELIIMADYLLLQNLKTLAGGVLLQGMNVSNCYENYFFFERYQCEELSSKIQKFILANFSAVYAANRMEVLNMSIREIEMFISSDEINVSAEEDVFKIILSWIDHDKSKRKKHFAELFRHVRLVYVSRDFLCSDVVTNNLVKDSEGCLDLVEDAVKLIESKDFSNLSVTPRKSLETSAIVINTNAIILCYFPGEDKWRILGRGPWPYVWLDSSPWFVSCRGNLYEFPESLDLHPERSNQRHLVRYNPFSDKWLSLPYTEKEYRYLQQIFVTKDDELCALMSEACKYHGLCRRQDMYNPREIVFCGKEKHVSFITKYKPESNSWEDITSFDHLNRCHVCIVANDDFVYFIGGVKYEDGVDRNAQTEVDRYDLRNDQWSKVADIHEGCSYHRGAVVNEKIFIVGHLKAGYLESSFGRDALSYQCQVYNETTNVWQVIESPSDSNLLAVDGKLYAVGPDGMVDGMYMPTYFEVQCYDPVKNKWNLKSKILIRPGERGFTKTCSMRIYKEFLETEGNLLFLLKHFIPPRRTLLNANVSSCNT
ncbi:kelch repeat and BTB domain-containing protein 12-like [Oculina patagonica]